MKTVLAGPAQSGKSCLRAGLKQAIRNQPGAPYPYFITGCPDGEGAWFAEAAANHPQIARNLKDAYKASFTTDFARRIATAVTNCPVPMTFVDIGGKITPENRIICAPATHIVLLAGDADGQSWTARMEPWRVFAAEMGLIVVAELYSDYYGQDDHVQGVCDDGIFRASVHHLDREVSPVETASRASVKALARFLISLVEG